MATTQTLTQYLKYIREREGLKPQELAEKSGIQASLIYKAETMDKSVKVDSLRKGYYWLCRNEDEWYEILMRWALAMDRNEKSSLYRASEVMKELKEETNVENERRMESMASIISKVAAADIPLLERFLHEFAKNPHARTMAAAWIEAVGR